MELCGFKVYKLLKFLRVGFLYFKDILCRVMVGKCSIWWLDIVIFESRDLKLKCRYGWLIWMIICCF